MKATVDAEACTGCALCEEICPSVFEMTDDDIAKVKGDTVPADAEETAKQSVEDCPAEAIKVE